MKKQMALIFILGMAAIFAFQVLLKNRVVQDDLDFRNKLHKNISILHQSRNLCPKLENNKVDLGCLCQKHNLINKQIERIERLLTIKPNFDLKTLPLHDAKADVDVVYDIDLIRSLKQELGFCDESSDE